MTPERIGILWTIANRRHGLDPIFGDVEAEAHLHNRPDDMARLPANIAGMETVRRIEPGFFAAHDYEWVFEPSVWRRSLEANYQVRALQQLSSLWRSPHCPDGLLFDNVVLRETFHTGADPCTPFHTPVEEVNFVVAPFSFSEFALLLIRTYLSWAGCLEVGWTELTPTRAADQEPSPFLRHAILRLLTSDAFQSGIDGPTPMERVKCRSSWFAPAQEFDDVERDMVTHLSYALIDFALAHELGHCVLGHAGESAQHDLRIKKEKEADAMGFHLYATSWGWRDEILDTCPLSQGARILIGPLVFHMFIKWHLALRAGIGRTALRCGHTATLLLQSFETDRAESTARTNSSFAQTSWYEDEIARRGYRLTRDDAVIYRALTESMIGFLFHAMAVAAAIPDEDYRIAAEIGDIGI